MAQYWPVRGKNNPVIWVDGSDMFSVVFSFAHWLDSWWSLYRPLALCVSALFVTGYPINRNMLQYTCAFVLGGLHFVVFSSSHQCTFHSSWVISLIAQGQGKLAKLAIGIFWLDLHFGFAIGSFASQYNPFNKLRARNKVSLLKQSRLWQYKLEEHNEVKKTSCCWGQYIKSRSRASSAESFLQTRTRRVKSCPQRPFLAVRLKSRFNFSNNISVGWVLIYPTQNKFANGKVQTLQKKCNDLYLWYLWT